MARCQVSSLEAINDLIMFEGTSVKELKKAFHEAVDDYLETCKEMGRAPHKGSFNVRIPSDLHRKAAARATMMGVSLISSYKRRWKKR